jgi:hypothetical protein
MVCGDAAASRRFQRMRGGVAQSQSKGSEFRVGHVRRSIFSLFAIFRTYQCLDCECDFANVIIMGTYAPSLSTASVALGCISSNHILEEI